MFYISIGVAFGVVLALACSHHLRRSYPTNMVMLSVFTLAFAFLVAMIVSTYDVVTVLLAFVATCAAVGAIGLFAIQVNDATCPTRLYAAIYTTCSQVLYCSKPILSLTAIHATLHVPMHN